MLPASYPITESIDTHDPRFSKFGGDYPMLETEKHGECSYCGTNEFLLVAQLYIPTLPQYIQNLFPEKFQNSLIVFGICPRCIGHEGYIVRVYDENQLDNLIYHTDIGPEWATASNCSSRVFPPSPKSPHPFDKLDARRCYIEPHTVTEWKTIQNAPNSTIIDIQTIFEDEGFDPNHLFLELAGINLETNALGHTLLGGWPHFAEPSNLLPDFHLLLNISESLECSLGVGENGSGQLWVKASDDSLEFKYTCSCTY